MTLGPSETTEVENHAHCRSMIPEGGPTSYLEPRVLTENGQFH